MRRRAVLGLPTVGLAALTASTLSACGGSDPVSDTDASGGASSGTGRRSGPTRHTYGSDPSQFGDLYLPDGTPRGTVVVIHGGFWLNEYDLTLGAPLAASLAQHGWAAWNIEYRRVGSGRGDGGGDPQTMDDVATAIDTLATLEVGVALDGTKPVVALGHSAGGQLAGFAASRGRFSAWQPVQVDLTHVVSQAGVLDLRSAYEENLGGGAVQNFLGHAPGDADDPIDPIRQVPIDQPVWCIHGTSDTNVPISQSQGYVAAATKAGATAELHTIDGDHFTLIDPTSSAWADTLAHLDTLAPS